MKLFSLAAAVTALGVAGLGAAVLTSPAGATTSSKTTASAIAQLDDYSVNDDLNAVAATAGEAI